VRAVCVCVCACVYTFMYVYKFHTYKYIVCMIFMHYIMFVNVMVLCTTVYEYEGHARGVLAFV